MSKPENPKILLLAHNLADAAIERRASMLLEGGATVTVAGFRRTDKPVDLVAGCPAVNFGQTFDYGYLQRINSVLRTVLMLKRHKEMFENSDIVLARNLEMLAIGVRGRSLCCSKPVLFYESLDIHRLLLRNGIVGKIFRAMEGWLSRSASALFTSSPAFVSQYFDARSNVRLPVRLIENKMSAAGVPADIAERKPGPPWIIGWYGIIRCNKSLKILSDLVKQSHGRIEVVIRGRPDLVQFENFEKSTTELPGLRFLGLYKYPDDLARMYENVHFTWTIDMFEEGLNSAWLLPNRLYEGGAFASVPIADAQVETGRFLKNKNIGVLLQAPLLQSLVTFFERLTPEQYMLMEQAVRDVPRSNWVYDREDCKALVDYMQSLKQGTE